MQNFQNDLQMLGMDHYQVGQVIPTDPLSQQFLVDPRRCGGCGGGFHCGGHHCGGFHCGGFHCGGYRCGGYRCGGCYSCYGCGGACYGSTGVIVI
jgi:heterocycloanthracin/sonorensin family bacteriocin